MHHRGAIVTWPIAVRPKTRGAYMSETCTAGRAKLPGVTARTM